MDKFVVSARKYRPVNFEDVVGQQGVTQTLLNAVNSERLPHAMLFCGPRGVGKTTCARILARVINAFDAEEDNTSSSLNIFELDAASNNSVEDIRTLMEQVRVPPQHGKYKVYIIDEVHMLSQAAFNAFLKTLEEPPPYAIFILATTEKHKIIPTILSRCQIFDFKRIGVQDIIGHLESICAQENIEAEKNALHVIAEKADGALRDALSMFDRLVDYNEKTITLQSVLSNLNILDYDYYFNATNYFLNQQLSDVLMLFDEVISNGFDGDEFLNGFLTHARNLMVCKDPKTATLLEVSGELREKYENQAQKTDNGFLINAMNIANSFLLSYKSSKNKRLHVELAIIKMGHIPQVEKMLAGELSIEKKKPLVNNPPKTSEDTSSNNITTEQLKKSEKTVSEAAQKKEEDSPTTELTPKDSSTNVNSSHSFKTIKPKKDVSKSAVLGKFGTRLGDINKKNEAKENTENEEAIEQAVPDDLETLDEEKFNKAWLEYLKVIEQTKPSLHDILKNTKTELNPGEITAFVSNKRRLETLNDKRSDLQDYIKNALGLKYLKFSVNIDETLVDKKETKAFTAKEKLKQLEDKNPTIKNLRKTLDLRLEE